MTQQKLPFALNGVLGDATTPPMADVSNKSVAFPLIWWISIRLPCVALQVMKKFNLFKANLDSSTLFSLK